MRKMLIKTLLLVTFLVLQASAVQTEELQEAKSAYSQVILYPLI